MTFPQLLVELARLGVQLNADGERLRYAPKAALTPELAERLREHKPAVLAYLRTGVILLDAQTATVADVLQALDFFKLSRVGNSDAVFSRNQDTESGKVNHSGEHY